MDYKNLPQMKDPVTCHFSADKKERKKIKVAAAVADTEFSKFVRLAALREAEKILGESNDIEYRD